MAGPGGTEVGRVHIRVVPDASGFRNSLRKFAEKIERQLAIKIPTEIDNSGAVRQLNQTHERLKAAVQSGIKIPVNVDTAELRRFNKSIKVTVDNNNDLVDASRLAAAGISATASAAGTAVSTTSKLAGAAASAAGGLIDLGAGSIGLGGKMGAVAGAVAGVIGKLVKFGAVVAAIGLGIGAAASALGLLSTAFLGLSGAIAVAGAGFGVVKLGMEGIKKAAQEAAPAFKKLKTSISSVFETQLTPVFQQIGNVLLPKITTGLERIAGSLSAVAASTVEFVTSARGLDLINTALNNISAGFFALRNVIPTITDSFLVLAEQGSAAFTRFVRGPLQRMVDQFNALIRKLAANGTLAKAFDGLGATVEGLSAVFNALLEVGVKIAAKFGDDFGRLFSKLAVKIEQLYPQIEKLVQHFIDFADAVIKYLPAAIVALNGLLDFFRGLAEFVASSNLGRFFIAVADGLNGVAKASSEASNKATEAGKTFQREFTKIPKAVRSNMSEAARTAVKKGEAIRQSVVDKARFATQGFDQQVSKLPGIAGAAARATVAEFVAAANPMSAKARREGIQTVNRLGVALRSGDPFGIGAAIANGVAAGIHAGRSSVVAAAVNVAVAAVAAMERALGISSPSKAFRRIGEFSIAGFIRGLLDNRLVQTIRNLVGRINTEFQKRLSPPQLDLSQFKDEFLDAAHFIEDVLADLGVNIDINTKAPDGGDERVHQEFNFYNPVAEPASDTFQRRAARLAALGLFT